MTDQQHEALARPSPREIEAARGAKGASAVGSAQAECEQELDKGHEANLRNLQQYICELLIKNQQLRSLLKSATNHHYKDLFDDEDQILERR
jgi:hypothetical protein